ncbi:GntR family transcriptional regulator [Comamonas serinivorans]|uniref:GntR family transcriptional regulator n=1 Tax=Comamonas serinivorans TaxID=1082851 RepID=A0A1Y0ELX6_9BURK|nr:GntR family transcriptional regulator [Comamonas serinivorans]ARU04655.1 GntR family transcriptional regulator [Comamonas serinivorans]
MSLNRRPLYEEVADQLRDRIFRSELSPGDWLDELKLASEMDISRTPMREAIKVLAAEGLVQMKPRRGAYVSESSPKDLHDIYHLLGLLESDASAELARLVASDTEAGRHAMAELEALHEQLRAAAARIPASSTEFFRINEAFHLRLLQLADNRWRTQMVQDLRKLMKLHRHHSLLKRGRISQSFDEHEQIMAALRAGQPADARAVMQAHFASGLEAAASPPAVTS